MGIYSGRYTAINELKIKNAKGEDVDPDKADDAPTPDAKLEPDKKTPDPKPTDDVSGENDSTDYTLEDPDTEVDDDPEPEPGDDPAPDSGDPEPGDDPAPDSGDPEPSDDPPTDDSDPDAGDDSTDYTVPDDDDPSADGGDPDTGDDPPADGDEASTDYTADTQEGDDPAPADGDPPTDDNDPVPADGDPPVDGDDGGATDYTADTQEGDDPPADGSDTSVDGGSDEASELQELETKLFSDLTPEQMNIKHIELKTQFIDLYGTITKTITRVSKISKSEDNLLILEFITKKLLELKDLVNFNLTKTYVTKTYIENEIDFQHCLAIFNTVSKIIEELAKKKTD